jgi:hypothetical protein
LALGERLLREHAAEHREEAATWLGQTVAIDLATRRVFRWAGDRSPLDHARELLDEGIVYHQRWTGSEG